MNAAHWTAVDLLLLGALLTLGGGALGSRDLRRGVILFVAFGLVLALAWARLHAPDVALAEAAIGAGLAGALLLAAVRELPAGEPSDPPPRWLGISVTALVGLLAAALAWALWHGLTHGDATRLADRVAANLDASGVSNPVTAVLLNFRAYDTLLELAVLLAALLGVLALGPARAPYRPAGQVLGGLAAWLVPLLILTAGYQLWVGAHAPGGAFQAGALLGAAGVILYLTGRGSAGLPHGLVLRLVATSGIAMFLLVGLGTLFAGGAFLEYRGPRAGILILVIEVCATLAIAATLVLAYRGGGDALWHREPEDRQR